MGGSSSKGRFFWQKKKKKSPLDKAWSQLRGALPNKKGKKKRKKSILPLDKLKREKHSQKRFSLSTDKREPTPMKRFSLGNTGKESVQSSDGGGLGKVGEQIKRKLSQDPKKGFEEAAPPSVKLKSRKEEKGTNGLKNGASKKRLDEFMRSIRP